MAALALVAGCDLGDVTTGGTDLTDGGVADMTTEWNASIAPLVVGCSKTSTTAGINCHGDDNAIQGPKLASWASFSVFLPARFIDLKGQSNPIISKPLSLGGMNHPPTAPLDAVPYIDAAGLTTFEQFIAPL